MLGLVDPWSQLGFLGDKSDEEQYVLRAQELNQGRATRDGHPACMVHEQLNGKPFISSELKQFILKALKQNGFEISL
jgi:hypothetical protein